MLLINLARAFLTGVGVLIMIWLQALPVGWFLLTFVIVMAIVFTLGDLAEAKLIKLFNPESKLEQ